MHTTDIDRKTNLLVAKPNLLMQLAVGAAIVLSLYLYFNFIVLYSFNMPNADDFDMFINFLIRTVETPDWLTKFKLLFERHGEHFILTNRLAALFWYGFSAELNFRQMIILGNLAVPLSCLLLSGFIVDTWRQRLVLCAPAAVMILNPQYYQINLWASGVMQHLWIMPYVLGAFLILERALKKTNSTVVDYLFLLILAFLATFSQGNGLFCPLLIGLRLILAKKPVLSIPHLALSGFTALFFLYNPASPVESLSASISDYVIYILGFLGSPFGSTFNQALLCGALSLLLLALGLWHWDKCNSALLMLALFVVLTASANSIARAGFGVSYAYQESRYTYPALFYWAALFLQLIHFLAPTAKKIASCMAIVSALIFSAMQYASQQEQGIVRRDLLQESAIRWQIAQTGLEYPNQERGELLLLSALRLKLLSLPRVDISKLSATPYQLTTLELDNTNIMGQARGKVEWVVVGKDWVLISGYAVPKPIQPIDQIMIELISAEKSTFISTKKRIRPKLVERFRNRSALNAGFLAIFKREQLSNNMRLRVILRGQNGDFAMPIRKL